ncbi:unnamed protein product, partial [Ixodes hexagonus]
EGKKEEEKKEEAAASDHDEEEDSDEVVATPKKNKKLQKYEKLLQKPIPGNKDENFEKKGEEEEKPKKQKRKPPTRRVVVSSDDEKSGASKKPESAKSSSLDTSTESDSDASGVQPARKRKKPKQESSSNGTSSLSDDSDFETSKKKGKRKGRSASTDSGKANKKKRRRIKVAASTDDDDKENNSDDDVQILNSSQEVENKGRKNIRKVISSSKVTDDTRAAAKAEEERKKRVQERQKLSSSLFQYNEIRGSAPACGNTTLEELVLEMDLKTKEPLVVVNQDLVKCMKPHQVNGVKFMYECTIESLEMLKKDPKKGSGCILAHCMGLGKTFQVISFLHTVMNHKVAGKILRTALIVCPYNTVLNWAQEFERWLEDKGLDFLVHEMSSVKDNYSRVDILEYWQKKGGAMILGYDMFRRLTNEKAKGVSKKLKEKLKKALLDPGPDVVACDEGHILKNAATGLAKAMNSLRTGRRIILTGTPLQNNLTEYHCMVQFVKPNLLGTKKEFTNRFANPIANGQCADSTVRDVKLMKKRVHILHRLLDGCLRNKKYNGSNRFEPVLAAAIHLLDLSFTAKKQCRRTMAHISHCIYTLPPNLHRFARLCGEKSYAVAFASRSNKRKPRIREHSTVQLEYTNHVVHGRHGRQREPSKVLTVGTVPFPAARGKTSGEEDPPSPIPEPVPKKEWWDQYVPVEDMEKLEISGKMSLLYNILQECDAIGDKILVFSQSLLTLDMVEKMLEQCDERASAVNPETAMIDPSDPMRDCHNTWVQGIDYFRMDGSTSVDLRKRWIEMFNNEDNPRGRLFLISTRAGSLGTNLVGANRVVIMDASWNPTHDVQAIFRVYRFGQKKPVFIYRFLAQGTMEEKIYDRQVTKQSLACRVVDEQQIERHFNAADLMELYSFSPDSKSNRPTPMVPKDRLLAEMLMRHNRWIVSYHEHDSLLQNVADEDLTEEERKLAWEEYKEEGRRAASTAEELLQNNASGQSQVFSLDLQKLITDIRARNPTITNVQLSLELQRTLLGYQTYFKRQQMTAFERRSE